MSCHPHLPGCNGCVCTVKTDQQLWVLGILSNAVPLLPLCVLGNLLTWSLRQPREEKQGGEMWVAGVFEAGPLMSAVIIVRLKVGHTLWACLHKEQECSHCAGRLAGWEYYGRAELCRARQGQRLLQCLTIHSAASVCIYFHYLIAMCVLIICDNVWEVVCRVRLRYGAN